MNFEAAAPLGGWRFMKFRTGAGRDAIEEWLSDVPIGERRGVRAYFIATLRHLRYLPRFLWRRPQFDWLSGERYKGIGELRFDFNKVKYRPLGCFGPQSDQFTILIGCRKARARKGRTIWKPSSAPETAALRRQHLIQEERCIYELDLDSEAGKGDE